MKEYSEKEALHHIKSKLKNLPQKELPTDETILDVIDSIWAAYDSLGLLELDFDEDYDEQRILEQEQQERRSIIDFVKADLSNEIADGDLDASLIGLIFDAENEYEESIL